MPPKRKRVDVDSESTASGSRNSGGSSAAISVNKTKSRASKSLEKRTSTSRKSKTKQKASEEPLQQNAASEENIQPSPKKSNSQRQSEISAEGWNSSLNSHSPTVKNLPYAKARMEKLFVTYADVDDPSIIGGQGLERLCADANISMEGAQPLILAWLLEASELGKLTKEEWLKGFHALQIDTLEKLSIALTEHETLLVSNTPVPEPPPSNKKSKADPYNRNVKYWHYTADTSGAFLKFYHFVFSLAKSPQERNIDVEIAKVFWSTLLGQKYPLVDDLIEYIANNTTVKGVNKDLWAMTLDFCRCVSPTLEGYDAEGAWPALLDEFVAWKKASSTQSGTQQPVLNN